MLELELGFLLQESFWKYDLLIVPSEYSTIISALQILACFSLPTLI